MQISINRLFYFCYNKFGDIMQYNFLKDNIVVVCSNQIKLNIIDYCLKNKLLFNIKYISLNELIDILMYSYDEKTIVSVMDEFNLNFKLAKMYLSNIKYCDFECSDNRILFLKQIIDFCKKNNLFESNELLTKNILSKEIFIIDSNISSFEKRVLDYNDANYIIVGQNNIEYKHDKVYKFNGLEDEVHFVANNICDLISSGVDVNNISIVNIDDESDAMIKRIFKMYSIPYNCSGGHSLYETSVGKYFLENIKSDINKSIELVKTNYSRSSDLINSIIDIINKYYFIDDFKKYKEILVEEFKNKKLSNKKLKNAVKVKDFNNIFNDDEYVFLIGFNLGVIPKIYKDEDYISDNIKPEWIENTVQKNIREKELARKKISSIKNLTISYKLNYLNETFYPSNLIDDIGFEIVDGESIITKYSELSNRLMLAKDLDLYMQFGEKSRSLPTLLYNYPNNGYRSFSNRFLGLSNFNKDIMLSYSSMDTFYKCAFRYYLANILRIDIFNENFSQYIGKLFHHVLEVCLDSNEDVDKVYDEFILNNEYDLSEKNKFFLNTLKDEIKFIIETIKVQYSYSEYKDVLNEERIEIDEDGIKFKGFIDKILMKDDKIVIIDYKTGSIDINLSNVKYGLSMQLPVYLYLAKKLNKNAKIVGFYLQHILNNKPRRNAKKSFNTLKRDALKLQGYSLGCEEDLSEFDSSYKNSEVIKGMKMGNNGFYHYSKVLTEKEIDNLINFVDKKIKNATNDINNAKFTINPKIVGKNNEGCAFCKFKDICFLSEGDKVYLDECSDLSFLGGEDNA